MQKTCINIVLYHVYLERRDLAIFLFFFKSYYLPYDNHNILVFLTDTLL